LARRYKSKRGFSTMPNATVRANARATPKPKPGSAESIRRQTADLNRDVALLKASQAAVPHTFESVIERETAKRDAEKHELFGRAYSRWLRARAALDDPDTDGSEEGGAARFKAVDEAARSLLITPPIYREDLWQKCEVLEDFVSEDIIQGQAADNRAIMALGCIKADLLRLGIGREA
jgi:hypothetical protein